jgi:hypothetical protein
MNRINLAIRLIPLAATVLASCATHHAAPWPSTPPAEAQSLESPTPTTAASTLTAPTPPTPPAGPREIFPHIRADLATRIIEIDGIVPLDCHDPKTPRVYLEQMICAPDSKEHESLVMTRAKPSHLHAALLAISLTPGFPGSFKPDPDHKGKLLAVPATGDAVRITITCTSPAPSGTSADAAGIPRPITTPITDWVVNANTGARFADASRNDDPTGFVFSGSRMVARQGRELYDADGTGTIVGLTSFGSEVISWRQTISPDSWIDEPVWICDTSRVPKMGTPVIVRIEPATTNATAEDTKDNSKPPR